MQALIFAAGLGTRLKPETLYKPKALVNIGRKTLLQLAIEKLVNAGVSKIVVNVHHFANQMIRFIDENNFGIPVIISDESEKLLDTGGGLKFAAKHFDNNSPILIYNVDILSNLNFDLLKDFHLKSGSLATMAVRNRETQRYLKFDTDKNLVGWMNKKTGETKISIPGNFENATEMAFSGIHIIQPELFNFFPKENRFSIIDVYLELAKSKPIKGYFDNSDLWMDVGKPAQLEKARKLFKN